MIGEAGADRISGRGGDDSLIGAAGRDTIIGGDGADKIFGGGASDRLFGGPAADRITGGGGRDVLRGDGGRDSLFGGAGNDRLLGAGGNDRLVGGGGRDTLIGGAGRDALFGGGGADRLFGGGGNDRLVGGGGNDRLVGGGGRDKLFGGKGGDRLDGGGANDVLNGDGGRDQMFGGAGNDTLRGGAGNDVMKGGRGADTFVFTAADVRRASFDRINDFRPDADRIDLRQVNGVTEFDDLDLTAVAGGVEFSIGKGRVLLSGRTLSEIDEFDFILPGASNSRKDPFTGGPGPDAISSGPGDDLIRGLGGDDKLGAGAGRDTLVGGDGADIFVVRLVNGGIDPQVDVVRDFKYALGDKVGLTEVLSGVVFGSLDEVVRATPTNGDTMIAVKRGGAFENVLRLEGVTFKTEDLIYYGFTAPPRNSSAFIDNPYGFANNSLATVDPAATPDGSYVAWVDQQNLDNDPFDVDPASNENNASRDVFIMNTETGVIQRVSERSTTFGTFEATSPAISDDGRFVAYVQGSRNSGGDIFVRDMAFPDRDPVLVNVANSGFTTAGTPISTTNRGGLAGSRSNESAAVLDISADGGKVAFITRANLSGAGESDANNALDVYLRDLKAGTTTLISEVGGVAQGVAIPYPNGDGMGDIVKISADGRYVAFASAASFVGGDQDGSVDIYLYDTVRDRHLLVSTTAPGGATSFDLSDDARSIVFATGEAIAADDTNGLSDIYVARINLSDFRVVSRDRVSEAEGRFEVKDNDSYAPVISPDGDRVAFLSTARDLVAFDPRTDFGGGNGFSPERLYVVDLDTGALTTPAISASTAVRDSVNTQAALTDDALVYRHDVPAAPGGNRQVSDVIGFADLVAPPSLDVPGGTSFSNAKVDLFTSFRSTIDSPSDSDIFQFRALNQRRDISISVEALDSDGGTLANPTVTVYRNTPGVAGNIIGQNDNGGIGRDAFVVVEAPATNRLFIEVTSADGGTGSYRVTIDTDLSPPNGAAFSAFSDDIL